MVGALFKQGSGRIVPFSFLCRALKLQSAEDILAALAFLPSMAYLVYGCWVCKGSVRGRQWLSPLTALSRSFVYSDQWVADCRDHVLYLLATSSTRSIAASRRSELVARLHLDVDACRTIFAELTKPTSTGTAAEGQAWEFRLPPDVDCVER